MFTWNIGCYFMKFVFGCSEITPPRERSGIRFSATTTVTVNPKRVLWKKPQILNRVTWTVHMTCFQTKQLQNGWVYIYIYIYIIEYSVFRGCDKEICVFVYTKDSPLTLKGEIELSFMEWPQATLLLSNSRISFEFYFVMDRWAEMENRVFRTE